MLFSLWIQVPRRYKLPPNCTPSALRAATWIRRVLKQSSITFGYYGPPKPTFWDVFMVNNLVFRWPTPLFLMFFLGSKGSQWLNQPIWKICSSNWIRTTPGRGENANNFWNHHSLNHFLGAKTLLQGVNEKLPLQAISCSGSSYSSIARLVVFISHSYSLTEMLMKARISFRIIGSFEPNTPPKFNSSPLKNDGWKTTFPFGRVTFQGRTLKLLGCTQHDV